MAQAVPEAATEVLHRRHGQRGDGSLAIDYDLGYSIVFVPIKNQLRAFARLRELAEERGKTVDPTTSSSS